MARRRNGPQGVIYVAGQDVRYVCEAIASAESLRAVRPDVPISLLTDIEQLFGGALDPFDQIIPLPIEETGGLRDGWGRGLMTKVRAFARSPYEKTLFLDTDTRVLDPQITDIFGFLDEQAMALVPCSPENSLSCRLYGPMFNTGVVAYRMVDKVRELLRQWETLQLLNLQLATTRPVGTIDYLSHLGDKQRHFLLLADQTSFARLLSPAVNELQIPVRSLDDRWNARCYPRDQLSGVIVDHADCHKIEPSQVDDFLRARGIDPE